MIEYMPRILDEEIDKKLKIIGCILIEGCKWCGKSTTSLRHAKSVLELQNVDNKSKFDMIAKTKPSLFLEGNKPLLIDEWQMYPVVWDAIRHDVDKSGLQGQYILTGSARPADGTTMHSGTGRITRVLMRPMSLYESKESDGAISLQDLFDKKTITATKANITLDDVIYFILRGGWPNSIKMNKEYSLEIAKNYYASLLHENISLSNEKEFNANRLDLLLRSLSRNISSPVNISTIEEDILAHDSSLARNTISSYIDILKKLYVIENISAWTGKIRSKIAIRSKEKLQFVDPSIACASLGLTSALLKEDLNTLGLMFESLCMRDLRIYAESLGGQIFYYRDETDLEVDAIIVLQDGRWGAIEIKLSSGFVKEASENLLKFQEKVDIEKLGAPSFLMILVGDDYSYQLENGVYVVSIGNLKN